MDAPILPWREIAAVIFRRRAVILAVFGAGLTLTTALAWLRAPVYQATAKVMVTSERARITVSPDAGAKPLVDRVTEQDLNSEVALLQSIGLVREVLEPHRQAVEGRANTGLASRFADVLRLPLQVPQMLYAALHDVAPPSRFETWVAITARHVSVTPVSRSNLIEVAFVDDDAVWAADLVNALVTHHVERHVRLNKTGDTRRFFESQRELLSRRLDDAEQALSGFYEREGFDSVPEQQIALRNRLVELDGALGNASTALAEATARAAFLDKAIQLYPKSLPADARIAGNDGLQLIKSRILQLELQRSELLAAFAPTSLKVQQIERQLAEARRLLADETRTAGRGTGVANPTYQSLEMDLAQTRAQGAALEARIDAVSGQLAEVRKRLEHLDAVASEQQRLENNVAAAKEAFVTYLKKEEEARFADALDESRFVNVSIVESATVPSAPLPSQTAVRFAAGVCLSLIAAVALAVVRDRLDPTVKSAAEAAALTDLPVLADIPS
jgi:uncharacterized protein involved in exopolysaccharide biosynthesis